MSLEAMAWAIRVAEAEVTEKSGQQAVLFMLANFANEYWETWHGHESLAKKTRLSQRSIQEHLARLEELELIASVRRRKTVGKEAGQWDKTVYRLNLDADLKALYEKHHRKILPVVNEAVEHSDEQSHRKNLPVADFANGKKQQTPPEDFSGESKERIQNTTTARPCAPVPARDSEEDEGSQEPADVEIGSSAKLVPLPAYEQVVHDVVALQVLLDRAKFGFKSEDWIQTEYGLWALTARQEHPATLGEWRRRFQTSLKNSARIAFDDGMAMEMKNPAGGRGSEATASTRGKHETRRRSSQSIGDQLAAQLDQLGRTGAGEDDPEGCVYEGEFFRE